MVYATISQLEAFLGTAAPSGSARMLKRASELIDMATMDRIDTTSADQLAAAANAVCAQVEFWDEEGESTDISGPNVDYTVGGTQIKKLALVLSPRARSFLFREGLLYRGASTKNWAGLPVQVAEAWAELEE